MKSYIPQPGTIPHRAIEHLRTLGPGAQLSTAALANDLDQPTESLTASLAVPRKRGALRAEKGANGRSMMWSLGDGTPEQPPHDYEDDRPLKTRASAPVAKWQSSVFDVVAPPAAPPDPADHSASEPEPSTRGRFRYAYHSDGTLLVVKGTASIHLGAIEARELFAFGARMADAR